MPHKIRKTIKYIRKRNVRSRSGKVKTETRISKKRAIRPNLEGGIRKEGIKLIKNPDPKFNRGYKGSGVSVKVKNNDVDGALKALRRKIKRPF